MRSLFAKLSIALLAIVGVMGAAIFTVDRISMRTYYDELTQHLNAPIAMYVTEQRQLIASGVPDLDSLPGIIADNEVRAPTLILVGEVVALHEQLGWYKPGTEIGS